MLLLAAGSGDTQQNASNRPSASGVESNLDNLLVRSKLKLDFTWSKTGFGSVMEANFVITNDSDKAVKDLEITCVHSASSGTIIDRNSATIYEIVAPHKKKRIPNFNMGFIHSQAKRSSCSITDFQIVR